MTDCTAQTIHPIEHYPRGFTAAQMVATDFHARLNALQKASRLLYPLRKKRPAAIAELGAAVFAIDRWHLGAIKREGYPRLAALALQERIPLAWRAREEFLSAWRKELDDGALPQEAAAWLDAFNDLFGVDMEKPAVFWNVLTEWFHDAEGVELGGVSAHTPEGQRAWLYVTGRLWLDMHDGATETAR